MNDIDFNDYLDRLDKEWESKFDKFDSEYSDNINN